MCVIATPSGLKFVDADRLAGITGFPVRSEYKQPDEPDVLPPADAFAVAPATFNTVNKWAHGISDTLALGLLNEAVGAGRPIIAAPWPNNALSRHPAFGRSVADLRAWGVTVLFDPAVLSSPDAPDMTEGTFPWTELCESLRETRAHLKS
ncbi:flavoprotein [Actinomadura monticuli]|uniref:Flavoprotein n=1 Tax=Actinomadura monticuli TaxID=3097367 RepID=A0ABV4QPS4_9ACTN